jgi:hypothetical protein
VSEANRTRRTLLQGLVVALGGDQAGWLARLGRPAQAVIAWLSPRPVESAPPPLSTADVEDLVAFTGVLARGAELSEAERRHIVEHIDAQRQAGEDYQLEVYRTTARLLEQLAGARFATLDVARRLALVRRHELGRSAGRPEDTAETREVRARAVPDLIGAYYGSAAGWAIVGYGAFPGQCGVLERYTRPEA